MNDFIRWILFLPEQASTFSYRVDRLHFFVIGVTMIASFLIGTTALIFFWRFRRRSPGQTTPDVTPGWKTEGVIIAGPLAFFLLWFVIGFRDFAWLSNPPPDAMDVYVTGKQWMWHFTYPQGPGAIDALHVPAGRPVRLLITSRDVIHSFFVPAFRIKMDALPGRYTQTWFEATRTGTYEVYCAEYCGLSHSRMLARVVVMEPAEFDRWLEERTEPAQRVAERDAGDVPDAPPATELAVAGQKLVVAHGCLQCHTVDGTVHLAPSFRGLFRRAVRLENGQTVIADEAYMTESMMDPRAKVVEGFAPTTMPSFHGRLQGPETAAIVEFIKSLGAET